MASNDGGPAFPNPGILDTSPMACMNGMSLRAYLTAKADPREMYGEYGLPPAAMAAINETTHQPVDSLELAKWRCKALAKWKVMMADAMLKVLEAK